MYQIIEIWGVRRNHTPSFSNFQLLRFLSSHNFFYISGKKEKKFSIDSWSLLWGSALHSTQTVELLLSFLRNPRFLVLACRFPFRTPRYDTYGLAAPVWNGEAGTRLSQCCGCV